MSKSADPFVEVAAGQPIFREGEVGDAMFIIESGTVDILRAASGMEPLATLGAGDFFGEMAILEDQPRFASAMAREKVRLLRIERASFADLLKQNVEIAVRIMRKLVARQRRTDARLADALSALAKTQPVPPAPKKAEAPRAEPAAGASAAKSGARKPTPLPPSRSGARAPSASRAPLAAIETPAQRPAVGSAARTAAKAPAPMAVTEEKGGAYALRHASGAAFPIDFERSEMLVGRPDPVTGVTPEVNLGPLDGGRSLSRRHAKIVIEGGLCFLREEVGTVNGTYVNDERLRTGASVPLKRGDRLRFGAVEVVFASA